MTDVDEIERRYKQLESELGNFNLGQAIRFLAGLQAGDERWDAVIQHEVRRVVQLHAEHYAAFQKGNTVIIGRNPLRISDSRDELMATIGFMQGATFVVAALQAQGRLEP
jgi:hypothetical protein